MQYRQFGRLDIKVSALGFGCMRLPIINDDTSQIDEAEATRMLHTAIDGGINYVDTAYGYHRGRSEPFVGRALQNGYRDKVYLATKMPSWLLTTPADLDRLFEEQLERLQTDHIDFYLLHSLNQSYWDKYMELKVFDWTEKRIAAGQIRHLGFSFHDDYPVFETILNGYDHWDFCQIQYNYLDVEHQAGLKGLRVAAKKGLGVVIMEPLRGGNLAKNPPPSAIADLFATSAHDWTPANWGLQWIWDQPEVSLLLSGMTTLEQVEQNLESASRSGIGTLSDADCSLLAKAREVYKTLAPIPCTQCEYCLPCPNGVEIPQIFELFNEGHQFENQPDAQRRYRGFIKPENRADQCVECCQCETLCPQHIEIVDWLKKAHVYLQV